MPRSLPALSEAARRAGERRVGGVYRRTRIENGVRTQRAEVRFDEVAGCLRTPAGGSSRQILLLVDGPSVRSRLISARETARLIKEIAMREVAGAPGTAAMLELLHRDLAAKAGRKGGQSVPGAKRSFSQDRSLAAQP